MNTYAETKAVNALVAMKARLPIFVAAATIGNAHDAMTFGLHWFDDPGARLALRKAAICGHAFNRMATRHKRPGAGQGAQGRGRRAGGHDRATHRGPDIKQ